MKRQLVPLALWLALAAAAAGLVASLPPLLAAEPGYLGKPLVAVVGWLVIAGLATAGLVVRLRRPPRP